MWELLDLRAHKCFWNGPKALTKIPAGHPNSCIHCDSTTTGQIRTISISMEPSWPIGFWWFAFTNQRHRWGTHKVGICTIMKYLLVQYKHNLIGMIFLLHQQWYVCEWGKLLPWPCQPVFFSQKVYEPLMEILWKYILLSFWFELSNQVTMLHMSRQLSCRDICKIVIRSNCHLSCQSNIYSHEIWIMST